MHINPENIMCVIFLNLEQSLRRKLFRKEFGEDIGTKGLKLFFGMKLTISLFKLISFLSLISLIFSTLVKLLAHLIPSSKHGGHVPFENSLNGSVQSLVQSHPLPPRHSVTVSISSRAHLGSNCLFFQFSNQDSMFWKVLFHR